MIETERLLIRNFTYGDGQNLHEGTPLWHDCLAYGILDEDFKKFNN